MATALNERRLNSQQDLFAEVFHAYGEAPENTLANSTLYDLVAKRSGIDPELFRQRVPVGEAGKLHSLHCRRARWHQQSLRAANVLERVDGQRGIWRLKRRADEVTQIDHSVAVIGFSTDLGVAVLGSCETVFGSSQEVIHALICSPPYPIAKGRAYGRIDERHYVDWLIECLRPLVANMAPTASLCLNISADCFVQGTAARSLYIPRLMLALNESLGLAYMDTLAWVNTSAAPGPIQWASMARTQLNSTYEQCLWFAKDPRRVGSDNRRVLQAHSERHMKLMLSGGERRAASYSDGAHNIREGSFGRVTEGKIPRNVLPISHTCASQREYKQHSRSIGIQPHGAPMPLALAKFLVEFMTEPGQLIADPFGGSMTTGLAAELLGRRWISTETVLEYVFGSSWRFRNQPGFRLDMAA